MNFKHIMKSFWHDEDGQSLSEYGLILALIAVVAIAALTTLGSNIGELFDEVATKIKDSLGGG